MSCTKLIQNQNVNIKMASLEDIRNVVKDVLFETLQQLGITNGCADANDIEKMKRRPWLTPHDVVELFNTSLDALAQMRSRRKGPRYTKSGGRIRYKTEDVLRFYADGLQKTIDQD